MNPDELHVRVPVGSEKVYRKLTQLVGDPDRDARAIAHDLTRAAVDVAPPPVSSRFAIDILSGTSAVGINAVLLAKAIASDQGLESLENVWITEGDISTLINHKG